MIPSLSSFRQLCLTVGVCALMLSGCSKDPQPDPQPSNDLLTDKTEVVLTEAGSSETIQITTDGDWRVVAPDALWYTIEPLSGSGNGSIKITSLASDYREICQTSFTIMSSEHSILIQLSQAQSNQPPTAPELSLPQDGATNVAPSPSFNGKSPLIRTAIK